MTIEQTIEIPANGWVHLDIPPEWAGARGQVVITALFPAGDEAKARFRAARQKLQELCEDSKLTSDAFLEQRRKDARLENSTEEVSPAGRHFPSFRDVGEGLETWDEYVARRRAEPVDSQERTERYRAAIEECCGLAKRMGCTATSDDFLEQRRKDNELENRLDALHEEERRLAREQRQGRE
jgi:hypothetical protein